MPWTVAGDGPVHSGPFRDITASKAFVNQLLGLRGPGVQYEGRVEASGALLSCGVHKRNFEISHLCSQISTMFRT